MMNYYSATAVASKITGTDVKEIRGAYKKGARFNEIADTKLRSACIVASQLLHGTYNRKPEAEPAVEEA